jgi:type III secretion protein J
MASRRPRAGLLAAALLALVLGAACRTAVLHGLPEADANRALAVLQDQGIPAAKQPDEGDAGTWRVVVPRKDAVRVWSVLRWYRVPGTAPRRIQDVFGQKKLVVAPLEERALYLEALQGEIAHTLESVAGVVSARVHVAVPEPDLSGRNPRGAKASVMLEFLPDTSGQAPLRADEVQKLVANGVNDLAPESVSVVMKPIGLLRAQAAYDFVAFGPLIVAAPSVTTLKLLTGMVVLLLVGLGAALYWNGKVVEELRDELRFAQQSRAVQKPPRPAP